MAITRTQQARQMLKNAGAVEQDGVMNYIKNSESVTVPKEFKARKNAPATKLAYITAAEAKMLKNMKNQGHRIKDQKAYLVTIHLMLKEALHLVLQ